MEHLHSERKEDKPIRLAISQHIDTSAWHHHGNEDSIGSSEEYLWGGVFDGIGGSYRGDLASKMAVTIFESSAVYFKAPTVAKAKEVIELTMRLANYEILAKLDDSQTTAVVARIVSEEDKRIAVIGSVGDSRAYLLRDNKLTKITKDDSGMPPEVEDKIDKTWSLASLTEEDEFYFYNRNLISQCLGMDNFRVNLYDVELKKGDSIVLTSDGVHDNLTIRQIERCLNQNLTAESLVAVAKKTSLQKYFRSKIDDISAVILTLEQ